MPVYLVKGIKLGVPKILFESDDKEEAKEVAAGFVKLHKYDEVLIKPVHVLNIPIPEKSKLFIENSYKNNLAIKSGGKWKSNSVVAIR